MVARLVMAILLTAGLFSLLGCDDSSDVEAEAPYTTVVVLGEGLAAGMGSFGLSEESQKQGFSALVARQMLTDFSQPLMQAPGLGDIPGFPKLPVRAPVAFQTTILSTFPPAGPFSNVAIPGFTLADALNTRPVLPIIHRNNAKQTLANLILGMPDILSGATTPLTTQLEYAQNLNPTLALVAFGYVEVIEAAVNADAGQLPDIPTFSANYTQLLATLRTNGAEVLVLTVPDPIDSAYFSSLESAARVVKSDAAFLAATYGLQEGDQITVPGLIAIGNQFLSQNFQALPAGAVLAAATASAISQHVSDLNAEIISAANQNGATVYDLHAFFRQAREGVTVGSTQLNADYLGGVFSLNGFYPGATGHALIANEIMELLNERFGTSLRLLNVEAVLATDPVAKVEQTQNLVRRSAPGAGQVGARQGLGVQFVSAQQAIPRQGEIQVTPGCGLPEPQELEHPLQLPPGLEQTLSLNPEASYFGDAFRVVDCVDPNVQDLGNCGEQLFGGLGLLQHHISGEVHIRFAPPVDNITRFEITFPQGLVGEDSYLTAPQVFQMISQMARVDSFPGTVSSGDLNLETGVVTNLQMNVQLFTVALATLVQANPAFPMAPVSFPGEVGSSAMRFTQREDGRLDFTFYGSTFVPLTQIFRGAEVRWPFPFCDPSLNCTTIRAVGTALHPHLHLTTEEVEGPECGVACPDIPENTIVEFTPFVHNNNFGDVFSLNIPELGGEGTGRSHLMGRLHVQFGSRTGDTVPVAFTSVPSGGLLFDFPPNFLDAFFPGPLPRGMIGFDSVLRFPLLTYEQFNLSLSDEPLDIGVGMVNLRTGKLINELLYRAFIAQDLLFALLIVEPRTPSDGFCFRGPASFERGVNEQTVFRYNGPVRVPYPAGFAFPAPDLKTPLINETEAMLDPFRRIQAMHVSVPPQVVKTGSQAGLVAPTDQQFSVRYTIPCDPVDQPASFEFTNATLGGTFEMTSLSWVSCTNSKFSQAGPGDVDTLSFTGFGTWSLDSSGALHVAAVHISTAPDAPYVGVQIDGGLLSSVDTKPENIEDTLP